MFDNVYLIFIIIIFIAAIFVAIFCFKRYYVPESVTGEIILAMPEWYSDKNRIYFLEYDKKGGTGC